MYLNNAYSKAIHNVGGLPILVPIDVEEADIAQLLALADGVLLTGGFDVHPFYYGEEPHPKLGEVVPKRDELEIVLTKEALKRNIPFLGICRGQQILNVALGGTLYQDLGAQLEGNSLLMHSQKAERGVASHSVNICRGNLLFDIVEEERIATNSFHHQAVKEVASGLKVVAKSQDGVIEALVHESLVFCLSVQWHPEEQAIVGDETAKKIFKAFVDACK